MSKGFDHLKKLSEWVVVDDRVRQSVIGAGFGAFLDLSPLKHDHALLSSLVEHYDVSERCFVFNDVKLHFGLEDVWHITGLPIDGEAVTGVEGNSIQLSEEYLGENLCEGKRGAIKLSTLKNRFQNVPVGIDSSELTYYIRAYLLYVLGTAILPDKSGSLVPTIYLPLLKDIEKVHHYAWGAALLAHLHVALANYKKQGSQSIMGHTFSLLVFVLLRILKILRLSLRLGDGEREDLVPPIDFPLAVGWSKVLFDHSRSNYNKATREDYSRILDSLQDDDITWQPYIRPQALPLEYYSRQQSVARSRTVLICYEKAVYHRPDVAPKQFGYKSVVVADKMIDLKVSGRSGPKKREGKDWSKKYDEYVSVWKRRTSPGCLIEEEVVVLENAAGEASVEGTFSQGGDACQTNEQGKVVVLENVGGEASVEATFSQGGDACQTDEQGGDSKTLMFAQISPSEQDLKETLCSLNFATPIQGVELDLEKMQIETSELQNWKMKFEELERKLKEKQHNSELALHQKVEELERELKGRYDADSLLHQKVEELERKLKEKQHNSEPALHQKCEDLKVKYNEEHEKRRKLYDQVQDVKGMLSMSLEEVLKEQHFQLSREAHECASSDPDWTEIISAVQCLVSQREDLKVKYNEEHEKRRKLYDQNQEANGKFSMSLDKVIKELEDMLGDLSFQN